MPASREKINLLVDAMLRGMESEAVSASADEVISAMFTLASRSMATAKIIGADLEVFRAPLELMYAELPPRDAGTVN